MVTGVLELVRVTVTRHWYLSAAQGESQVEPMRQQAASEGLVLLMMQLFGC